MSETTATASVREIARQAIIDAAQEYWVRSMTTGCYSGLIVESDGTHYWSDKINKDECGEAEYFNRRRDYWTLDVIGLGSCGWGGADEDMYETRELTAEERKVVAAEVRERRTEGFRVNRVAEEITLACGDSARFSRHSNTGGRPCRSRFGHYGTRWYVQTINLLHWSNANDGVSVEDLLAEPLKALDEIPVGFFDGEEASEEWEQMAR